MKKNWSVLICSLLFSLNSYSQTENISLESLINVLNLDTTKAFVAIEPFSKTRISEGDGIYVYPDLGISLSTRSCCQGNSLVIKKIKLNDFDKIDFKVRFIRNFNKTEFHNWYLNQGFKSPQMNFMATNTDGRLKFRVGGIGNPQLYTNISTKSTYPELIRKLIISDFQNASLNEILLEDVSNMFVIGSPGVYIDQPNYFSRELSPVDKHIKQMEYEQALTLLGKLENGGETKDYLLKGIYSRFVSIYSKLGNIDLAIEFAEKQRSINGDNIDELGIIKLQELYLVNRNYPKVIALKELYYPIMAFTNSTFLSHTFATFAKELEGENIKRDLKIIHEALPFINYPNFNWSFQNVLTFLQESDKIENSNIVKIKSIISEIEKSENEIILY